MDDYYNFTFDPSYVFKDQLETSAMIEKKIMENIVHIIIMCEIILPLIGAILGLIFAYFMR